jgi:urease accessory protein UreE
MASKFETLYNTLLTEAGIDPTEEQPADPQAAAQAQQDVQPQVPSPEEVQEPTADVTSEGKKFLVELARQALAVDPDMIPATEKELFNIEITNENAEEILKRIQSMVDLYS